MTCLHSVTVSNLTQTQQHAVLRNRRKGPSSNEMPLLKLAGTFLRYVARCIKRIIRSSSMTRAPLFASPLSTHASTVLLLILQHRLLVLAHRAEEVPFREALAPQLNVRRARNSGILTLVERGQVVRIRTMTGHVYRQPDLFAISVGGFGLDWVQRRPPWITRRRGRRCGSKKRARSGRCWRVRLARRGR